MLDLPVDESAADCPVVSPVTFRVCCAIGMAFNLWSVGNVILCADLTYEAVGIVLIFAVGFVTVCVSVSVAKLNAMGCLQLEGIYSGCNYLCWQWLNMLYLPA